MSTPATAEVRITIKEIIELTARFFGVAALDITGMTRMRRPSEARHAAMYFARDLLNASYREIGEAMGGRDHTTAMNGVQVTTNRVETEPDFAEEIKQLRAELNGEKTYAIAQSVEEYSTVYVTASSKEEALELYREGAHSEPTNKWWDNERVVGDPSPVTR